MTEAPRVGANVYYTDADLISWGPWKVTKAEGKTVTVRLCNGSRVEYRIEELQEFPRNASAELAYKDVGILEEA